MQKKYLILSKERELPILHFLWKWKMASTALIHEKFFPGKELHTAYRRMWELKHHRYVDVKLLDEHGSEKVWTLNKRGFWCIKEEMPPLREVGYKSEHGKHDLICNALHMAEFVTGTPRGVLLVSEQQLRRYDQEFLPDWVPDPEIHRPDGYWHFSKRESFKTIALEVELNRKRALSFRKVVEFYRDYRRINAVLWVVPNFAVAGRIRSLAQDLSPNRLEIHNFVILKEFLNEGWSAPIVIGGMKGQQIKSMLWQNPKKSKTNRRHTSDVGLILDTHLIHRNYKKKEATR